MMFKKPPDNDEKIALLLKVFSDSSDTRIEFFCEKFTLVQLKDLVELRNMAFENGEIEPHAIDNYQLILSDKTIGGMTIDGISMSDDEYLPPRNVNEFDTLFNLIVKGKYSVDFRILWQRGPIQRQRVSRLEGSKIPLMIVSATLAIYAILVNLACEADRAANTQRETYIQNGLCINVKSICTDMDDDEYVCDKLLPTQQGISCDQGKSFFYLCLIAFVILGIAGSIYCYQQGNELFQSMRSACNDPKYDELLNALLLKHGREINWSEEIKVNGANCSLRKLTLALLLCFDDRMYSSILPDLIQKIQDDERQIEINYNDVKINLNRTKIGETIEATSTDGFRPSI